jgi:hypothetical protein
MAIVVLLIFMALRNVVKIQLPNPTEMFVSISLNETAIDTKLFHEFFNVNLLALATVNISSRLNIRIESGIELRM